MSTPCSLSITPDHPVWTALCRYRIGPPDAAIGFTDKLARTNGWTDAHAARVVEEYKRFCFLAVTGTSETTPSDAVDQAWHLHLTYSRDCWERFCPEILGKPLHHDPSPGGADERHRMFEQYADTLARYEQAFGAAPPADIWPDMRTLSEDHKARRVHPRDGIVISAKAARIAMLVIVVTALAILFMHWFN